MEFHWVCIQIKLFSEEKLQRNIICWLTNKTNQSIVITKNDKLCGIISKPALFHLAGKNPNGESNWKTNLHEIKENQIDFTSGPRFDDFEKTEELQKKKKSVFRVNEDNIRWNYTYAKTKKEQISA